MKTLKRLLTVVLAVATIVLIAQPIGEVHALGTPVVASTPHKVTRRPVLKASSTFNEANLTWKTVKYAENYELWRKEGSKGEYHKIYEGTNLKYTDMIADNVTYYYKVRAVGPLNYKESKAVKVAPKKVSKAPVVKAKAAWDGVTLTWKKVTNTQVYSIYRSEKKNSGYVLIDQTTELSYYDYDTVLNKTYYYKVKANGPVNAKTSKAVKATPKLATPKVKVSQSKKTPTAKVSWNEIDGAVCYDVFVSTRKNGKYTQIVEDYIGTYLEYGKPNPKKTYYFKVVPKIGFADWKNDPVIQEELYAVYVMEEEGTPYEYLPKIYLLANESFIMEENMYEGIITLNGDFQETDTEYIMEFFDNSELKGTSGEGVTGFRLQKSGNKAIFKGDLVYSRDGAVFTLH